MHKEVALTEEGLTRLQEELEHLETTRRREVGQRIKEAKEFGDLSENSEYDDAKNEQAFIEARIAEIHQILASATVISEPKTKRVTKVILGSKVKLKDLETGEVHHYRLVGSAEADPSSSMISNESPVGKAVIGASKGDTVGVTVPSGKVLKYEVLAVSR